jgi:hypothetical protein
MGVTIGATAVVVLVLILVAVCVTKRRANHSPDDDRTEIRQALTV